MATLTLPVIKYKQPRESILYAIDFTNLLDTGETISAITAEPSGTPAGLTIGAGSISGTQVTFRVSGGTDAVTYLIWCTVTTSTGNIREGDAILSVTDIVAPATTPSGSDYLTNMATVRTQASYQLTVLTASLKPDYSINGQAIQWTGLLRQLFATIKDANALIEEGEVDGTPFEIHSQGIP